MYCIKQGRTLCSDVLRTYSAKIHDSCRRSLSNGDKISFQREVTDKNVDEFIKLTGDDNPVHVDNPRYCHGALLIGFVSSVIGTKLPGPGTVLVHQNVKFPNPCYVNQTLTITVEVVDIRKLVTCKFYIYSHLNKVNVLEGEARLVVKNK
ncbi:hypothetical protein LSTR_LSTR015972 [Laodelphax striatellus]|uniref:MaoC-like domain-containing protein n=1 Tax=Laodelphax striatellus TaxID=195883 RepID=A0A482XJM9_LAOST|nr:hypothetical protein LSTR_LSTR015972 [Laodelphax striatellus]